MTLKAQSETITFKPTAGFVGVAAFDYTISDGAVTSSATVDIMVVVAGA